MRKHRIFILILLAMLLFSVSALADTEAYTNGETGYTALIEDDADLLSDEEEHDADGA